MAVLRLMRPGWLIPAVSALNLAQADTGYRRGLRAGANVVTINLTPENLQRDYLLYKRERFIMDEARVHGTRPGVSAGAGAHQCRAAHRRT